MHSNIRTIIESLEEKGMVLRIESEVDPKHELAGIAAAIEGTDQVVLFEKVKGASGSVLMGLYWSRSLLSELFSTTGDELPTFIAEKINKWTVAPQPHTELSREEAPVFQNSPTIDLLALPVPVHALKDGGPYIDAGVVIARDPDSQVINASIQRFQVIDETTLHVNIDAGRHLGNYLDKARRRGEKLYFSINIGVAPGVHFAAATPSEVAPIDSDELGIASEFQMSPVRITRGNNPAITLLADAMYTLECEIVPDDLADEGPFAEVTGYYAEVAPRPRVTVTDLHHQNDPIFHSILSGQEVFNSVGLLGESSLTEQVSKQVPGIKEIALTFGGCGFYHAVVRMEQCRAGWSKQAILATFAAFPPVKMVTVVDEDVNPRDSSDVEWAMATRLDPDTGILRIPGAFGHGLNPSFPDYIGTKVGFDATRTFPKERKHDRISYVDVDLSNYKMTTSKNRH